MHPTRVSFVHKDFIVLILKQKQLVLQPSTVQ